MNKDKKMMLLFSIVQPDKGQKLIKTLKSKGIHLNFQSIGYGTAPTEMMDIFGLNTNHKDIVISLGAESSIKNMMTDFSSDFNVLSQYGGLMIVLQLSAASRLIAEIVNHNVVPYEDKGEISMKNEHHNNLIFISVNNGYADVVMEAAKKVGATGGTIIKGRLADYEQFLELGQSEAIEEEREIICILAPELVSREIMNIVNKDFGFSSKANGIICAVPTEKAYKI